MLPATGCSREMCGALLFQNLRSSLDSTLADFPNNNHFQDRLWPSLGVGSGWSHPVDGYQFACGGHPSPGWSDIQELLNLGLIRDCASPLPK